MRSRRRKQIVVVSVRLLLLHGTTVRLLGGDRFMTDRAGSCCELGHGLGPWGVEGRNGGGEEAANDGVLLHDPTLQRARLILVAGC